MNLPDAIQYYNSLNTDKAFDTKRREHFRRLGVWLKELQQRMAKDDGIKTCPFCGQPARAARRDVDTYNSCRTETLWSVGCDTPDCWCNLNDAEYVYSTKEQAIKYWNKRSV